MFRTVFVLRVVEGISGIETAASLGLHETTVRTRLYRAHRRLGAEAALRMRVAAAVYELTAPRLEHLVTRVLADPASRLDADDLRLAALKRHAVALFLAEQCLRQG